MSSSKVKGIQISSRELSQQSENCLFPHPLPALRKKRSLRNIGQAFLFPWPALRRQWPHQGVHSLHSKPSQLTAPAPESSRALPCPSAPRAARPEQSPGKCPAACPGLSPTDCAPRHGERQNTAVIFQSRNQKSFTRLGCMTFLSSSLKGRTK